MSAGPWTAVLVRRTDGYGVRINVELAFPSREAAVEAGQALLGHLDVRLADVSERLREEALPPARPAVVLPTFAAPS